MLTKKHVALLLSITLAFELFGNTFAVAFAQRGNLSVPDVKIPGLTMEGLQDMPDMNQSLSDLYEKEKEVLTDKGFGNKQYGEDGATKDDLEKYTNENLVKPENYDKTAEEVFYEKYDAETIMNNNWFLYGSSLYDESTFLEQKQKVDTSYDPDYGEKGYNNVCNNVQNFYNNALADNNKDLSGGKFANHVSDFLASDKVSNVKNNYSNINANANDVYTNNANTISNLEATTEASLYTTTVTTNENGEEVVTKTFNPNANVEAQKAKNKKAMTTVATVAVVAAGVGIAVAAVGGPAAAGALLKGGAAKLAAGAKALVNGGPKAVSGAMKALPKYGKVGLSTTDDIAKAMNVSNLAKGQKISKGLTKNVTQNWMKNPDFIGATVKAGKNGTYEVIGNFASHEAFKTVTESFTVNIMKGAVTDPTISKVASVSLGNIAKAGGKMLGLSAVLAPFSMFG